MCRLQRYFYALLSTPNTLRAANVLRQEDFRRVPYLARDLEMARRYVSL
jgi:thiazole synthase ThiGH ThiG subunit